MSAMRQAKSEKRVGCGGRRRPRYVLGLMAGTSGDGIDAVCVRIDGRGEDMRVRLVRHDHRPFAAALRRRLMAVMAPAVTRTEEIARLHAELGEAFGVAAHLAIEACDRKQRPTLIGLAGQTVCHLPGSRPGRTVTLQLGDASRVAARSGVVTVSDFRQGDEAAGGQGAPLVPWTDWVLFRNRDRPRIIQNIGGVANLTWLPPGARAEDVVAFDTGPGNMIVDGLVAHVTGGRERMDRDGRRAARGRVLGVVLERWLEHPFLARRPPKTTGREEFGRPFVEAELGRLRRASSLPEDWVATATALTARTIAEACRGCVRCWLRGRGTRPTAADVEQCGLEVIVGGGGAKNPVLMGFLAEELRGCVVHPIDSYGIPSQSKEGISFAMLAAARVDGVPANLPGVTGARGPALMGLICVPPVSRGMC